MQTAAAQQTECPPAYTFFATAYAVASCAHFRAGDCVAVKYSHKGDDSTLWYEVRGKDGHMVMYPSHHLERFCL